MNSGIGLILAGTFFLIAITWIGCDQYQERQCRERQWRWTGTVWIDGRCEEP